jgi:glycosyltransferase involved in cell wall biosynthesis
VPNRKAQIPKGNVKFGVMNLSIIIPLYNEQNLVIEVLKRVLAVKMPDSVESLEIVVVDDCSTDDSNKNVSEFIKDKPMVRLLKHEVNMGKGAAVRTGISNAKGDVYLIQDADLELSPSDIPSMINAMVELGVQFVNGSRYLPGVNRPLAAYKRYLANKFFTFLTSLIVDVNLTDMACGYKIIHKDLWEQIDMKENRFGFEAELIVKALRIKRNNIAELPVKYFPRNEGEGKKLRNLDGLKILKTIIVYGLFKKK